MMVRRFIFMLGMSLLPALMVAGAAAEGRVITLDMAIATAQTNSVEAAAALDELHTALWQHRIYRAGLLPELSFDATVPSYSRSYNRWQAEDGSYRFVRTGSLEASAALTLSQSIWLTGGTVSLTSRLDYMRQLDGSHDNSFMALPVALTLRQPLFAANTVKWNRRIEPLRLREARAQYTGASELVAVEVVEHYFALLLAREEVSSAEQNLENAVRMAEAARIKRAMGQISRNDSMQIELTLLTAQSELTAGRSSARATAMQLGSFIGLDDAGTLEAVEPSVPVIPEISYERVLEQALAANALTVSVRRRQLEADFEVARARGAQREVTLFAQVGFSGADAAIGEAYGRLHDNSIVQIGMSIPLVDWGKRRAAVRMAESRSELVRNTLRKEVIDFRLNLFVLVERLNNQAGQYRLAYSACDIAQRRYDSMVETFLTGRISTLDLTDAQQAKDRARAKLLDELRLWWSYYYQLRSLTLHDPATDIPLDNSD